MSMDGLDVVLLNVCAVLFLTLVFRENYWRNRYADLNNEWFKLNCEMLRDLVWFVGDNDGEK